MSKSPCCPSPGVATWQLRTVGADAPQTSGIRPCARERRGSDHPVPSGRPAPIHRSSSRPPPLRPARQVLTRTWTSHEMASAPRPHGPTAPAAPASHAGQLLHCRSTRAQRGVTADEAIGADDAPSRPFWSGPARLGLEQRTQERARRIAVGRRPGLHRGSGDGLAWAQLVTVATFSLSAYSHHPGQRG